MKRALVLALCACGQLPATFSAPPVVDARPARPLQDVEAMCPICPAPVDAGTCAQFDAGALCLATEAELNHTAGPNEPACSGANPDGGAGQVWGYHCGTALETRWLLDNGCVVEVLR